MSDAPRDPRSPDAATTPSGTPPVATAAETPDAPAPHSANQLTPEEQMALFEQELKETDWGHQPC